MAASSYQKQLDDFLNSLEQTQSTAQEGFVKPTLLLHACCGPCSSYVLEYLSRYFDITVLYYNPNIYPEQEYNRRLNELKTFYTKFAPAANVKVVEDTYNPEDFYSAIQIHEHPERADESEKGERCRLCYKLRLERAYEYAAAHNFDYYCTTLSISPFKDAEKINTLGNQIVEEYQKDSRAGSDSAAGSGAVSADGPKWLTSDFKKKNGFKRSLELSAEYGLYRQQYCGCVYSFNSRKE